MSHLFVFQVLFPTNLQQHYNPLSQLRSQILVKNYILKKDAQNFLTPFFPPEFYFTSSGIHKYGLVNFIFWDEYFWSNHNFTFLAYMGYSHAVLDPKENLEKEEKGIAIPKAKDQYQGCFSYE